MNLIHREERENLIEEYRILHDSVYQRGANTQTVNSILLPSSIIIVGIAVEFQERINTTFPLGMHASGFLPLFSVTLLLLSAFFTFTAGHINGVCFDRIHEIEKILGMGGHRYVYSKIRSSWWWRIRRAIWWIMLPLAMAICVVSSYYLFL